MTRGESSLLAPARKFSFSASRLGKAAASSEERRDSDDVDDNDGDGEGDDATSSADEDLVINQLHSSPSSYALINSQSFKRSLTLSQTINRINVVRIDFCIIIDAE